MAELQNRWVNHLRSNARPEPSDRNLSCPLCSEDILPDIDAFRAHVRADEPTHSTLTGDADIEEAFRKMSIHGSRQRPGGASPKSGAASSTKSPRKQLASRHLDDEDETGSRKVDQQMKSTQPEHLNSSSTHKKARSPPSSLAPASSPPTTPGRSHRRSGIASDFDRGDAAKNSAGRQLWNPPEEPKTRNSRNRPSAQRRSRQTNRPASTDQSEQSSVHPADVSAAPGFTLFRQPETRPITQDQLVHEVKGIYEGLRLVETKCIELSSHPTTRIPEDQQLSVEQYQKLIGLHRTLLHEHHDFFLASQHPSANPALRRLPAKYSMPARMWRHGIQSFLELLRKRLPDSREYMLTFIYMAYSTMTLLYETVPGFVETWIECLGDLGRYRMAIEDDDIRDRETWTCVSRYWYSKASDRLPTVGRLYHHLAILARPDALQQLYYYNKSLCVPTPFLSAWDSIMTLFRPILDKSIRVDRCDEAFVRVHAILFSGRNGEDLEDSIADFLGTLDRSIAERNKDWLHPGFYIAISLICSLLGYGSAANPLKLSLPAHIEKDAAVAPANTPTPPKHLVDEKGAEKTFQTAKSFAMQTCRVVFRRKADTNALPFFHTMLVFLNYVAQNPKAMSLIENEVPWQELVDVLNAAYPALMSKPRMADEAFPRPPPNEPLRPLPEDYAMRGLAISQAYFPEDWFSSDKLEDDEKMFEPPSLGDERRQRLLWLGRRICDNGPWFEWDKNLNRFTVHPKYDREASGITET